MDKTKLGEILLMEDGIVSMQDLVVMERLSTKYPYCSVFKVLGTKFAYILNSFNKTQWLELTGVYVSDREHLKQTITNINLTPKRFNTAVPPVKKEDIISKINSYHDEQLSDNPTKQELLEKFLKIENPKPIINNNDALSEDKTIDRAIKESAKKEFKFVTETMAKVYAKQGDKTKAIKIYQQLMEQNPKKSIYFANQIELLKNN